jgi:hypothetical protein
VSASAKNGMNLQFWQILEFWRRFKRWAAVQTLGGISTRVHLFVRLDICK